uniref:Signal sequence receptor subunit alpha n=1 Tax=Spongospora subterranea TaxID=70186 RepID=A0A0H5R439_9EUKA|eukprot:CRZ08908.1 hypothetical protein [Spongospora subterranea]
MIANFMSAAILAVASILALSNAAVDPIVPVAPTFQFKEFIKGEWDVSVGTGDSSTGVIVEPHSLMKMNITEDGSFLVGETFVNNTDVGVVSDRGSVQIEFFSDDPNSGVFKSAKEGEDIAPAYDFHFDVVPNGVAVSVGEFTFPSGKTATYVFNVVSSQAFQFTTVSKDGKVIVWFANRTVLSVEKTFLSKYGSTMLLVAVFAFNMFMQRKMKKGQTAPVAQPKKEALEERAKAE